MLLHPTDITSDHFHWDKASGQFIAEMSELPRGFHLTRVYDDACDVGLTLRSRYDYRPMIFVVDRIDRDASGEDIVGWHLSPALPGDGTTRQFSILIIND